MLATRTRAIRTRFLLVPALACLAFAGLPAGEARGSVKTFAANSLVIPMDRCYQTSSYSGTNPAYCVNPNTTRSDGVFKAYGLVFRLMQRGIVVYFILDQSKAAVANIDFSITTGSGSPVARFDRASNTNVEFYTGSQTIDYRGAPFVIDATDAQRALDLIRTDPVFNPTFNSVIVHVAKQGFQAPVYVALAGTPPRIALNDVGGAATSVLTAYLTDAGLNTSGAAGVYPTTQGEIYDTLDNLTDFTSGGLITGGYKILWTPHWVASNATEQTGLTGAVSTFVDQGGTVFAECASIETFEGSVDPGKTSYSVAPATNGHFQSTNGFVRNGVKDWGGVATEPLNFFDPGHPLVQIGDFPYISVGGHIHSWQAAGLMGSTYKPGMTRLLASSSTTAALDNWDFLTLIRKDNDESKGQIIYYGGHSYSLEGGERIVLNSLMMLGTPYVTVELARSAPIVYTDGNTYQGTYINTPIQGRIYPPVAGHFRAFPSGNLANTNVTGFRDITQAWDAAAELPPAASRTIFTAVKSGAIWNKVAFTAANAATLAPPMGITTTAATAAINAIRAGTLGGIDHSTPAIAGPSSIAGDPARPTVAYVGGLDGMLHAIAVSGNGVTPGAELWAFIPPSQLAIIDNYLAGVDGSPVIGDVFIPDSTGRRSWRTILAVTCGDYGGTVDVLDVTDPANPVYLWNGAGTNGTGYVMGAASGAAIGKIAAAGGARDVVVVATRNAGTAGNGFNLYALDAGKGEVVWQWNRLYTRTIPGTTTRVPNEVPPSPAIVNVAGDGGLDDRVFVADNDGNVWEVDATFASGSGPTAALWDPGTTGQPIGAPIALFRDANTGHLAILGASGGRDWVPATVTPKVFAVDAKQHVSGQTGAGVVLFQVSGTFAAGEKIYAAPTVFGNDVYLMSSSGTMGGAIGGSATKDAGKLRRVNLSTGAVTWTMDVKKGSGEVALAADGTLTAASAAGETQVTNSGRDQNGVALQTGVQKPLTSRAWLDLH